MTIPSRLPPFAALRGFEAAARLSSFRLAADELCLSTSAVSHNIRQIEEFVGQPLFVRSPKGVTLTRCGSDYLTDITPIFSDLVAATDRAVKGTARRTIILRCSPGCSTRWLMPQLNMLRSALGKVNVSITTQLSGPQPDAEIKCGFTFPPDGEHEVLLTTLRAPVCSSDYLKTHGPIEHPSDLSNCTLLREHQFDEWDKWYALASPSCEVSKNSIWFDDGYGAMSAAEYGMGVYLGHLTLLDPELVSGRLVQLFDDTISEQVVYTLSMKSDWQKDAYLVKLRNCLTSIHQQNAQAAE
jgi:LysR family glycine cleavage system transcriptional activator